MKNRKISTSFKFEEEIIDPILNCIKDNQEYLTKPENLPQLAKLGFMYNTLWYSGRVCWGSDGELWNKYKKFVDTTIEKNDWMDESDYLYGACEDNPKYKIEMCDPINGEIEDYIYGAWSMSVSEETSQFTFEEFHKIIYGEVILSEFEIRLDKKNKTMDEWVDVLTDPQYQYSSLYPHRKSVLNNLLCTIGTGYSINKDGFISTTAGGVEIDISDYGNWRTSEFRDDIQSIVNDIMKNPFVKETLDTEHTLYKKLKEEREKKYYGGDDDTYSKSDMKFDKDFLKELMDSLGDYTPTKEVEKERSDYKTYYPISNYSIIHSICDTESRKRLGIKHIDQSYIDASIEVCEDILSHQGEESDDNIKYAKKFLTNLGIDKYKNDLPIEVDKYEVERKVNEVLLTLNLPKIDESVRSKEQPEDVYSVDFRNTAKSEYGDNNFYIEIKHSNNEESNLPRVITNSVNILGNSSKGDLYKDIIKSLTEIDGVGLVTFSYSNSYYDNLNGSALIKINVYLDNDKIDYIKECEESKLNFNRSGFILNEKLLTIKVGKYRLVTSCPCPLGSNHPNNKSGSGYFSLAKSLDIYDDIEKKKLGSFHIDERGYNILYPTQCDDNKLSDLITESYNKFKKGDSLYGTYDSKLRNSSDSGSKNLYTHDFMLYLSNNNILK